MSHDGTGKALWEANIFLAQNGWCRTVGGSLLHRRPISGIDSDESLCFKAEIPGGFQLEICPCSLLSCVLCC